MKKSALAVAISLSVSPVLAEMQYGDFMEGVGAAQQQIDYSGGLVKRSELDKWILESDKNSKEQGGEGQGADVEAGGKREAWLPDAMKPGSGSENTPTEKVEPAPVKAVNDKAKPDSQRRERRAIGEEDVPAKPAPNEPQWQGAKAGSGGAGSNVGQYRGKNAGVSYVYLPMEDEFSGGTTYEMIREGPEKTIRYGIPIGTRFRVELRSGASSVQPGLVQVVLQEDVIGNKKTLERGAVLFMQMTAERGSERLFGTLVRGIERNRRDEFTLSGNIYGTDGLPGLIARVISDGRGVDRATDVGLSALGEAAISAIPGTNMGVDAGKRAGSSLLGDEDNKNQTARGQQKLVVQAEPQSAVIEIGETF